MSAVYKHVLDAVDIETFLICEDEDEGKGLIIKMLEDMGFNDINVVFIEHNGPGARIRARGYVHKSGDKYGWLNTRRDG